MKKILAVYGAPEGHWVGDGFPVRSLFSYRSHASQVSPFLMLDYAGPAEFPAQAEGRAPRGVGAHPHRGFETVTIVYKGELAHRDSTGQGGTIGPGDVQWMTAGAGILHEEFHSPDFSRSGGTLEMMQLWVNLPARAKKAAPGYQAILNQHIPVLELPNAAGIARVIAGDFNGQPGAARTFTPMNVWDLRLKGASFSSLNVPAGWPVLVVVMHGTVQVNGSAVARDAQMVVLDREGGSLTLEANNDATVLLLSGEPIDEAIVGHGLFVMNTQAEIVEAVADFNKGRFGQMPT